MADQLSNLTPKTQVTADGSAGPFSFNFKIWEDADLEVYDADTLKTIATHYTIAFDYTDLELQTGTVTFTGGNEPTNNNNLTFLRNVVNKPINTFTQSGSFRALAINKSIQRLWAKVQEVNNSFSRLIRLKSTTTFSGDLTFPEPSANLDKFIKINSGGTALEAVTVTGQGSIGLPIGITDGGSGQITAPLARTAFGLEIGVDVQADLDVPSQAEAEAGTATNERVFTAERVKQAIVALAPTPSLPRSYLAGLQIQNAPDADHDIKIAVGVCRSAADGADVNLASAQTKQIDVNWASGSAAGGISSNVTLAIDTWYHVIAGNVSGTAEVGFDTSVIGTNLIADHSFTDIRRIGSVKTDGSSNIIGFTQVGDEFLWDVLLRDVDDTNPGTNAVDRILNTPLGVQVQAIITGSLFDLFTSAAQFRYALITSKDSDDLVPSAALQNLACGTGDGGDDEAGNFSGRVRTNLSSIIRTRNNASSSNIIIRIFTFGWIDSRGRDD